MNFFLYFSNFLFLILIPEIFPLSKQSVVFVSIYFLKICSFTLLKISSTLLNFSFFYSFFDICVIFNNHLNHFQLLIFLKFSKFNISFLKLLYKIFLIFKTITISIKFFTSSQSTPTTCIRINNNISFICKNLYQNLSRFNRFYCRVNFRILFFCYPFSTQNQLKIIFCLLLNACY